MNSRQFVLTVFGVLILFSIVAWWLRSAPEEHGRVPLTWATDPNPARDPQIHAFNQLNTDCALAIDADSGDPMKIMVQCAAKMGPDLIDHIYYNTNLPSYVDAGILLDLTDIAEERGFGLSTLAPGVRSMVQARVLSEDGKVELRQFAYPSNVAATYIFYNKKLFRDAGMPDGPPVDMTWNDYIRIATQLNSAAGDGRNRVFGAAGAPLDKIIFDTEAHWFNADGTVCLLDSEEAFQAYRFYHDLIYKYNVEPTPEQQKSTASTGGWGGGYMSWFGEGRVGMLWGSRWMLIQLRRFLYEQTKLREAYLATHPGAGPDEGPQILEFGCVQVPRPVDGPRYTVFSARGTGVNAQSENIESALKFLTFLAGPEYSRTLNDSADSNPGNAAFYQLELFVNPDFPEEEEAHRLAIESVPFGRATDSSPFILSATANRSLFKVSDKLSNTADLSDAELRAMLKKCADEINLTIARNISREPRLQKLYDAMLKDGAEPIQYKDAK